MKTECGQWPRERAFCACSRPGVGPFADLVKSRSSSTSGEPFLVEVDGAARNWSPPGRVSEPPERWRWNTSESTTTSFAMAARCSRRARPAPPPSGRLQLGDPPLQDGRRASRAREQCRGANRSSCSRYRLMREMAHATIRGYASLGTRLPRLAPAFSGGDTRWRPLAMKASATLANEYRRHAQCSPDGHAFSSWLRFVTAGRRPSHQAAQPTSRRRAPPPAPMAR